MVNVIFSTAIQDRRLKLLVKIPYNNEHPVCNIIVYLIFWRGKYLHKTNLRFMDVVMSTRDSGSTCSASARRRGGDSLTPRHN